MRTTADRIEKPEQLPSHYADFLGSTYTATVTKEHKKGVGQFFTPLEISNFMGALAKTTNKKHIDILDPGCGTAVLTCSLLEKLISPNLESVNLVAYETDFQLLTYTEQSLRYLKNWLHSKNIKFKYELVSRDFIEDKGNVLLNHVELYDYIISNPPYFKLSKDDKRVKLSKHLAKGQSNIYSLFMAVSVNLLRKDGELIYIVPRSFASGQYFNTFRDYFFTNINLNFVHLFKSRTQTFDRDKVLQETLILKCSNTNTLGDQVTISTSEGIRDLDFANVRTYDLREVIDLNSDAKILHLPTTAYEDEIMQLFNGWTHKLSDFGVKISTGPVVSFRVRDQLHDIYKNSTIYLAPLFWLQNVSKMLTEWPKLTINKSQYIAISEQTSSILVPNKNYVLLRRFSSKDDRSRLIASPYFARTSKTKYIGIENKLNYIYKVDGELDINQVTGISALLNSKIFDTYFRTLDGNVNVSATEIRLMPFPNLETISEIGEYFANHNNCSEDAINEHINNILLNNHEMTNG